MSTKTTTKVVPTFANLNLYISSTNMMKINRLLLVLFLLPASKSFDYLRCFYFSPISQMLLHRNGSLIYKIKLLNLVIFIKVLHFLLLALYPLTEAQHTVLFDGLYAYFPKSQFNLMGAMVAGLVMYLNHVLFCDADYQLNMSLYDNWSNQRFSDCCIDIFFQFDSYSERLECKKKVRLFAQRILYLLQSLIYLVDLMVPYTHVLFINKFCNHFRQLNYLNEYSELLLSLFVHMTLSLLHWIFFYNLAHIFALVFSISSTLVYVFFVRMQHNLAFMKKCAKSRHHLRLGNLRKFQRHYIQTLNYFFRVNQMYGRVLLACLLVLCPINVGETMWLVLGLVEWHGLFIVLFFNLYQNIFILALHLALTFCTRRIYAPSKVLLHISATKQHKVGIDIRTRIRLEYCVGALMHNYNRYGFTYANFGLVSMSAFCKYLMLYGKFVMISYKLIQQSYL